MLMRVYLKANRLNFY